MLARVDSPTPEQIAAVPWRCFQCHADLPALTRICPGCRTRFQVPRELWVHDRGMVLAMLFLVAGPLGIPWLFRSPRFERGEKGFLTVAVSIYTAVLALGVYLLVAHAWRQVASVLR